MNKNFIVSEKQFQKIVKVINEQDETSDLTPNFYKTVFNPDDKSLVGAYMITGETDKMIEVLNIKEFKNDRGIYMDGAEPYTIKIDRVKLPKSQIEILGPVEGKEGFDYIKMPYWLFKKMPTELGIKRLTNNRRIGLTYQQHNDDDFFKELDSPDVQKHISMLNNDKLTSVWVKSEVQKHNIKKK